ncbi:uncharacterized protein CCR75_000616 [Bremia lactucae]|uniref:Uncharacterized protein n=1 Tax=Bremia lactucae TaxID=4779 RepID=A0A976IAN6_BRELC|nr:hypothetical protein CCR75_000616 [Bremia lactucae]
MKIGGALVPVVVAVLVALLLHVYNDFVPIDSYYPSATANASIDSYFSDSYYQAQALFRLTAKSAGATLFSLPLEHLQPLNLSVDIAVMKGSKDRVLLHISGTHGVEGFAGSAIQAALLERAAGTVRNNENQPTVVFVHALNAYGFAHLRRFNEHNVDLNRNWLTQEEFQERQAKDPNERGYLDMYDVLNPTQIHGIRNGFWFQCIQTLITKGFDAAKQAVVTGNYHFPQSVYYGGTKLEPSLLLLQTFLSKHINLKTIQKFGMIDVHTGLGAAGVDTLLLKAGSNISVAQSVFRGPEYQNQVVFQDDSNHPVTRGYEGTGGFVFDGVAKMLNPEILQNALFVCQEFGTVPGVFILKATIEENTMYHYHSSISRLPYAQKLRDVFYLHQSSFWKTEVRRRGMEAFDRLDAYLTAS